jgi:hypothetical protein
VGRKNEQSRPLLTFDIPQTALVATLDTYDFLFKAILQFFCDFMQINTFSITSISKWEGWVV